MNSPASLVDELMAQLQGAPLQQMAQQLGTSPAQTQDAVGAALPLLLGTLACFGLGKLDAPYGRALTALAAISSAKFPLTGSMVPIHPSSQISG